MRYRVVERKIYERCFVVEADEPEEVEDICRDKSYETDAPSEYAGTEYTIVGTEED